jgi:dual specificity tyrosine-phosphorylation-regulated kinase 2/3/4
MWSFGAIVAELYSGFPLFPGESEVEQLAYIMELYGIPPEDVLKISQRKNLFFNKNNDPILTPNSRGKIRQPGSKKI